MINRLEPRGWISTNYNFLTKLKEIYLIALLVIGLILLGIANYLLFHTIVELIGVITYTGIFIGLYNAYVIKKDTYMLYISLCAILVVGFDFIHIISYEGIGILSNLTEDLHFKTWLVARIIESTTLLFVVSGTNRDKNQNLRMLAHMTFLILFTLLLFFYNNFPKTYVNNIGVTMIDRISTYSIVMFLVMCLIQVMKNKETFGEYNRTLVITLSVKMFELLVFYIFIEYTNSVLYLTHVLKVLSYYLLYKIVISVCILSPYRELKMSEERYRTIVEASYNGIIIQTGGKIEYSNSKLLEIMGYTDAAEVLGNSVSDFIIEDHIECCSVLDYTNEVLKRQKKLPSIEKKLRRKDGKTVDIRLTGIHFPTPLKNSILLTIKDITEIKETQQLKELIQEEQRLLREALEMDRIKTEFFSNLSHELRTPLNILLGSIQLLEGGSLYDNKELCHSQLQKRIHVMKQNCYRLLRLINNMLDLTKFDSGYLHMNFTDCNIISTIEDITLSVVDFARNKEIEIVFDTEIEESIISCDLDKLERVVLNLLSNAIKFTNPSGKIYVSIKDEVETIAISVKDTGIGIPANKLNNIFDRFRQVDSSLHRRNEGSGIGLSLVKILIEAHGGRIIVKSKPDIGSEFIVKLPVRSLDVKDSSNNIVDYHSNNIEKIKVEFSDIYF
ncbi:MASE3 domain-containing sensor histidine kinase [Alkaliphilus hydrothermalis]|uniref:histidine kinase n=1 Tax=Alkaliphilus hydrothermalis TaxID=1482730 RepID=A0ABS2NNV3_9FIRM|nr:MASE3 domain-containing protein [Alkaliphilus hydrothermalis]MBM7614625.1 PAS domain S-box-containing protein [Alkaliphilus hydrothermalis]